MKKLRDWFLGLVYIMSFVFNIKYHQGNKPGETPAIVIQMISQPNII